MKFRDLKRKYKVLIVALILIIILIIGSYFLDFGKGKKIEYGVTFSKMYAEELGVDWQKAYLAILDDLKPKSVRLITYWNQMEGERDSYWYKELDWQVDEAQKRDLDIILVVGRRVPRWPECHDPNWLESISRDERDKEVLEFVKEVVEHYKVKSNIIAWQIENEPLFSIFGQCPKPDRKLLKGEINLVKSLDPLRPVIVTDSGELSAWLRTSQLTDVLGTTMYRVVWNKIIGYYHHWYPASFYYLKSQIVKTLFKVDDVIISELQAEPWPAGNKFITELSYQEQMRSMDIVQMKKNFDFAKKAGFEKAYIWGVEWWYWLKEVQGVDHFWEEGKKYIQN